MLSTKLEEIKVGGDKVAVFSNPSRNRTTIIRNKIKDFDCMDDMLIICTDTGSVLAARADFEYIRPSLTFHSLSSMGSALENYNFVSKVAGGESHTLLLTTSGFGYSFGNGKNGRLGLGDLEDRDEPSMLYNLLDFQVESVHATAHCSFAGGKARNEIPVPITHGINQTEKVTTVVDPHMNVIFSWGKGDTGGLGHDVEDDLIIPTPLNLSIDEPISAIVTGKDHVFAVNEEKNGVYCWGNYYSEITSFLKGVKSLKGNPKIFNTSGIAIKTQSSTHETLFSHMNSCFGLTQKGPLEIKTLDDQDIDEMDDCEIEIEEEDILPEDVKQPEPKSAPAPASKKNGVKVMDNTPKPPIEDCSEDVSYDI